MGISGTEFRNIYAGEKFLPEFSRAFFVCWPTSTLQKFALCSNENAYLASFRQWQSSVEFHTTFVTKSLYFFILIDLLVKTNVGNFHIIR